MYSVSAGPPYVVSNFCCHMSPLGTQENKPVLFLWLQYVLIFHCFASLVMVLRPTSARWRSGLSVRFAFGRPGVHFSCRVMPKTLKNGIHSSVWRSAKGIVWKTSLQACLLCAWATHLTGCRRLYVADRCWGQAVYSTWWPHSN